MYNRMISQGLVQVVSRFRRDILGSLSLSLPERERKKERVRLRFRIEPPELPAYSRAGYYYTYSVVRDITYLR